MTAVQCAFLLQSRMMNNFGGGVKSKCGPVSPCVMYEYSLSGTLKNVDSAPMMMNMKK